ILKVVEIFGMMNITRVPRCPEYMKGVINLRGKIIPVIDLRLKFGLEEKAHDRKTCIVVINLDVEGEDLAVGMIVDTVVEVRDFDSASIAAAPKYGNSIDTNFIIGMGKHTNGQVTILIDIDRLFEPSESEMLKPAAANQAVAES
ncbi:MAG: chemotaxis protein CheW, partial [Bdellovibrionales bacterium]|nr:chemotaxis protein CheW [Bdellovibrionales bacterium]